MSPLSAVLLALFGSIALSVTIGFVVGVAWGVRFAEAKKEREKPEDIPLLVPKVVTDERIRAILDAEVQATRNPGQMDSPRPYRMPGLDDGT